MEKNIRVLFTLKNGCLCELEGEEGKVEKLIKRFGYQSEQKNLGVTK